jgi:transitional endoplasmic reticulum ATPase
MASAEDQSIQNLLEALRLSPENVPLRKHVTELLVKNNLLAEAEKVFLDTLAFYPADKETKLGLADLYFRSGKLSAAFVVVEELLPLWSEHPPLHLLHARLLLASGEPAQAREKYKALLKHFPQLKDVSFEADLANWQATRASSGEFEKKVPTVIDEEALFSQVEKPTITFREVGGMEEVKEEIRLKIIHPLKFPELYKSFGKSIGGGILLYGPPGCGKTLLARATAGEVDASFISVGINDILDMWIGNSEKNLHNIFEQARLQAPCVLFFDEVDALGASRTDMRRSGARQLINQFLSELDGVKNSNEGVLILAATNTPWNMDPAFRRPGRFDRLVLVRPPDQAARESILSILLLDKPTRSLDLTALARRTEGFSGADLAALVDVAVEGKLRESMKKGVILALEQGDLLRAAKQVKATTKEWFSTAKNYALYANESGLYDDILDYLKIKK